MNIEQVLKSVEVTINKYKTVFPELVVYANIEKYEAETVDAILAYEKKSALISKELILLELKKHFNTAKEIFDESFHKSNKKEEADNLLVGMLEMAWIESFLIEINNINSEKGNFYSINESRILDMQKIFTLDNDNSVSSYVASEKLKLDVEKLQAISSDKEKLQFYNDNICSFSYHFDGWEISEYGICDYHHRGLGKVIFKLLPNNDIFKYFIEIRERENERLKILIDRKEKTIDKIKVLFENRAGQVILNDEFFRIETNQFVTFIINGAGIHPDNLEHYEVNLSYLSTSEEKRDFNEYLYKFYNRIFNNPNLQPIINVFENFGFNYDVAISTFKKQLQNSLDLNKTLNTEIKRIENYFPLNDFNNIIYSYYESKYSERWKCALFNALVNGVQYDFSIKQLEAQQVKDLIHIEQIFSYYKELLQLKKRGEEKLLPPQQEIKQKADLKENNKILEYETSELLEILIKKDNLLKTDYLQFIEKYNINTNEKLKTFYDDYLNFAIRKINLAIIEFFKSKEGQDYILNTLLKDALEKFNTNNIFISLKSHYVLLDDIFILNHENIFTKTNQTFINSVKNLVFSNNIFFDWDIDKETDFWEKFSKSNYFGWLNFTEINSSIRTISFLAKVITKTIKIENLENNSIIIKNVEVENRNVKPKISIQAEAFETIFSILKDFFEAEQQDEFKEVLTTFGTAKNKFIFKSNSNQFTDTFKKLFENNFILGCQKTDLINWIVLNFNFMYRNEVKEFKTKTVEEIISGNQTFCKKPIIEIKNGQISKIDY